MPSIVVYNQLGAEVGKINLSIKVFGTEPNMQVVYEVVKAERAAMRQGTHKVKNRSEVAGGGRKPWRQKGTGRARHGSIRSPQWRGGGVVSARHRKLPSEGQQEGSEGSVEKPFVQPFTKQ